MSKSEELNLEIYENSKMNMASYGMNQFFGQWITGPFGMYVFIFYEVQIGLSVLLVGLAFILYSIWNAFNDPLIGYLMFRLHMPWEEKYGKRFPWIVIGGIPWLFTYLLVFLVPFSLDPVQDQWIIFFWLLVSICLSDTLFSLWDINVRSMYPDKFRGPGERRTAAGFGTVIGMSGIVLSSVIPPLFIKFGEPDTFRIQALVLIAVGIIIFFIMVPGIRENEIVKARYKERMLKDQNDAPESFLKSAKQVITNKRFMVKLLIYFGYQAGVALLSASALYMVIFVLDMEAWFLSILMGTMLIGAFISVPLWVKLSQKINNNKKTCVLAGFAMFITFLPIFLVTGLVFFVVALFLFGIGLGGQWFADPPAMADVLDDVAVRTGKRRDSIYYGYQTFFVRLSLVFTVIVFAVIHSLTGFVEGSINQSDLFSKSPTPELALLGIRMHAALIPAILVLICTLVFWKFYDLTPEKVEINKIKLKELNL